jgi:PAS domain-containing protein
VTVVRDIDAQVKAEAALRENERHLRSLMESASNFVLFRLRHRPETPCRPRRIFVSPSIGEIVDLTQVFDFQSWLKMIHPDDRDVLLAAGRKCSIPIAWMRRFGFATARPAGGDGCISFPLPSRRK